MDRFDVLQDMDDQALAALENSAPLSDLVAALRAPGRPSELSGEAAAVAAFSAEKLKVQSQEKTVAMEKLSNVRWLPSRVGTKLGAATAAGMLAFTGVAAAAVTGSLPAPIQSFVHAHLGAVTSGGPSVKTGTAPKSHAGSAPHTGPAAPTSGATAPAVPAVPAGAGASTAGQCEAFAQHLSQHGRLPQPPAASLQKAATAAGKTVPEFCAPFLVHGKPSTSTSSHGGSGGAGSSGGKGPHGSGSTPSSTTPGHGHGHGRGPRSGSSSHSGNRGH